MGKKQLLQQAGKDNSISETKPSIRFQTGALILLILVIFVCVLTCSGSDTPTEQGSPTEGEPVILPLYISFVIHTEEDVSHGDQPKPQIPDYDGNEALMLHFTKVMREFSHMAAEHGVKINFGTDWTFSDGVKNFDPDFYSDLEAMGHEIDAHAHASFVPYSEVRERIVQAGGHPTRVASGMTEHEIYKNMDYFDTVWPEFQFLWGIALAGHGAGEILTGWVWRPSGDNWLEHDPDGRYIHIGHGDQLNSIDKIAEAVAGRHPDRINTYSLFISPREFKAATGTNGIPEEWTAHIAHIDYWKNRIGWWNDFLDELDEAVQSGHVEYASLTEVAEIFTANEANLDFSFTSVDHPRSSLPMTVRSTQAGYP